MKLTGFDLYRYRLPFAEPLVLKGATLRHREGVLLELTGEEGVIGWGEASPLPGFSRESPEEAAEQLLGLAASMTGRRMNEDWVGAAGTLAGELDLLHLMPSVRFGFELAVWNLYAAARSVSLPELISPHPRPTVPVNGLLAGSPDEVLSEVRLMRADGYRAIKLKVGSRTIEEDIELIRELNEELGEEISLRLDANRVWSLEDAERFVHCAVDLNFEYIEEPLADPRHLPAFARNHRIPVALDESLIGMNPEALEDHRYARAVVLKPTLLGGISRTLRLAERALHLGITPVVSSAYETGIGTMALVALAAGIGDEEVPAGLDTYRRLAEDAVSPRLDLPAAYVDVRATSSTRREIEHRSLSRVR
jgi:O-succinylbenzoate synthase